MLRRGITGIGAGTLSLFETGRSLIEGVGLATLFFLRTLRWTVTPPFRFRLVIAAGKYIGTESLPIITLTSLSIGAIFALQSASGFAKFGAESMVGSTVALSLALELAPVLTGLMVAGRAASGIATEIGSMRVTEQIDAMEAMAVEPIQYLVVPRFLASLIVFPALNAFFNLLGNVGSYLVGVGLLKLDAGIYLQKIYLLLEPHNIASGMWKALIFGAIVSLTGCFKGYYASGGAQGVGRATTDAVVTSSVLILVADYILTAAFFT